MDTDADLLQGDVTAAGDLLRGAVGSGSVLLQGEGGAGVLLQGGMGTGGVLLQGEGGGGHLLQGQVSTAELPIMLPSGQVSLDSLPPTLLPDNAVLVETSRGLLLSVDGVGGTITTAGDIQGRTTLLPLSVSLFTGGGGRGWWGRGARQWASLTQGVQPPCGGDRGWPGGGGGPC